MSLTRPDSHKHLSVVTMSSTPPPITITLAHETDWPGFRASARMLLSQGLPPTQVFWQVTASTSAGQDHIEQTGDLFGEPPAESHAGASPPQGSLAPNSATGFKLDVPPQFIEQCTNVILHADPQRFTLLYRLLWKHAHQANFRHEVLDVDATRARLMHNAVRRDLHKMKAFVRFRELPGERFVAWFEPEHHIVEAVAPFFVGRFTAMRWAIITPRGSIAWDGHTLEHGPAFKHRPPDDSEDAHEGLWLTYYANIFNPARLKMRTMQKEMPKKYWRNLPEASLIEPLAQQAWARSGEMIERSHRTTRPTVEDHES